MKNSRRSSAVSAAVMVIWLVGSAPGVGASDCQRWANQLLPAEVFPGVSTLTFGQLKWYNEVHFGGSAQAVCDSQLIYAKPYTGYKGKVLAVETGRGQADCRYQKKNADGTLGAFTETYNTVEERTIPKQWCCNQTPDGPYGDLPVDFGLVSRDYEFSRTQKDIIRVWNSDREGQSFSDIGTDGPGDPWPADVQNDYFDALTFDPKTLYRLDDGSQLGQIFPNQAGSMQVDHIIPRVDVSGCRCGPNTKANALLISAKLNNEMKNNCDHPTRKAILEKWSFGPN